jgi:hypothetical protein
VEHAVGERHDAVLLVQRVGEGRGAVDDGGGGQPRLAHPPVQQPRRVVGDPERPLVADRLPPVELPGQPPRQPAPAVVDHGRHHGQPRQPVRDAPDGGPAGVGAEGGADEVELVAQAQRVGQVLDVQRRALRRPPRVRVALAVPGPVKRHHVHAQLLQQLLLVFPSRAVVVTYSTVLSITVRRGDPGNDMIGHAWTHAPGRQKTWRILRAWLVVFVERVLLPGPACRMVGERRRRRHMLAAVSRTHAHGVGLGWVGGGVGAWPPPTLLDRVPVHYRTS